MSKNHLLLQNEYEADCDLTGNIKQQCSIFHLKIPSSNTVCTAVIMQDFVLNGEAMQNPSLIFYFSGLGATGLKARLERKSNY